MDRLAFEIATHGTDATARRALAEFGLRVPAPADARRALMGYALMIGETVEFDFALAAAEPKPTPAGSRAADDDGSVAAMSGGGISDAELAATLRRHDAARHLDLLARTALGRASLPAVAASPATARAAAEQAHRDRLWVESPERYFEHLMATVAAGRRDRQMGSSALGRAVLEQERLEDARRR